MVPESARQPSAIRTAATFERKTASHGLPVLLVDRRDRRISSAIRRGQYLRFTRGPGGEPFMPCQQVLMPRSCAIVPYPHSMTALQSVLRLAPGNSERYPRALVDPEKRKLL
jgi:hypothetical protein